ncbi:MAG: LysM peptidoglycan-binding domain-containing protein [Anaerolineales bacterium]|nr:MAG: LysM peptidoglycan-binding domain-containing protein [Anaerolineales bacterium]
MITKFAILWLKFIILSALLLSACQAQSSSPALQLPLSANTPVVEDAMVESAELPTPHPTRPVYAPGELVDYSAQTGDTLPALAVRFNTRVAEILEANTFIPASATTLPPGMPMKIPIYYLPFWGSPYRILPDSQFINGPSQIGFDTAGFIAGQPGWLRRYSEYAAGANRSAAEVIDLVALKFSLSPRLLLALLEYQSQALSQPDPPVSAQTYPLSYVAGDRRGLYRQLLWGANLLNNGYYSWRTAELTSIEHEDGRLERFDPWQNAATVSLRNFFNTLMSKAEYEQATSSTGFFQTYSFLFGDPWPTDQPHIPGSLEQPPLALPFEAGQTWAFTGGPHTAWGNGPPLTALDFAPPLVKGGCQPSSEKVTAVADGVIVRSEIGEVVLDLDGDGDERTGWNIFYLHVGSEERVTVGAVLQTGQPVGYPSCEGGSSTGTHVHMARKYNGEWIHAEGLLAFNLEGWVAHNGSRPYLGTLTRFSSTVTACECSNQASFIQSERR